MLCGSSGTRLRPLSRFEFSKQFLCRTGDERLFQRAADLFGYAPETTSLEVASERCRQLLCDGISIDLGQQFRAEYGVARRNVEISVIGSTNDKDYGAWLLSRW